MVDVENKMKSSSLEVLNSIDGGVFALPADQAIPAAIEGSYDLSFLFLLNVPKDNLWNLKVYKSLKKLIGSMRIKRKALTPKDVGFLNLQEIEFTHLAKLIEYAKPNHLILFLSKWPFQEVEIRKYETLKVGQLNVLRLPDLKEVKSDVDSKQKTWDSIKRYLDM